MGLCSMDYQFIRILIKKEYMEENKKVVKSRNQKPVDISQLFNNPSDKESFDPNHIEFMKDASNYLKNPSELRKYVQSELRRIIALGMSPIKAIYQNQTYIDIVGSKIIVDAIQDIGVSHVWLKLTDECIKSLAAPHRDPHGSLLNPEFRGKVLVAKVGQAGGRVGDTEANDPEVVKRYSGVQRQALFSQRKAYEVEIVSAEPRRFSFQKAMLIFQNWGFGVKTRRMLRKDVNVFQDQWIVEECNIEDTYADFLDNSNVEANSLVL